MSRPSKAEKTGKNRPVRGENWVCNRQVKRPRKSAFFDGPDDQMPFRFVVFVKPVIMGFRIRKVAKKLLRLLAVLDVLVDVHLSGWGEEQDRIATGLTS